MKTKFCQQLLLIKKKKSATVADFFNFVEFSRYFLLNSMTNKQKKNSSTQY